MDLEVTYDKTADAVCIYLMYPIGTAGVAFTYCCDPVQVRAMDSAPR